ncbi:hypothetical protein L798_07488 [Zootermopsis nevadensis]|uniref:Uncharacterized protein n=1 Tax=Zootermopsis nevadensis TaxID=136037 RepID=A0A067R526_ZOONE|nr:hypothetical protein L798_07488 [Zootermopsis nevadensis]
MGAKSTTQTSSNFLRFLACCHGYREVLASLCLARRANARVQQARDEVGMSLPIAHGCATREGDNTVFSPGPHPASAVLFFSVLHILHDANIKPVISNTQDEFWPSVNNRIDGVFAFGTR